MRVVSLFSGGLDSTVLLAHLGELGYAPLALTVHYGQRHAREIEAARAVTSHMGLRSLHREVDLSALGQHLRGSSQTDANVAVPHGHYVDDSMRATVVPNRNMILLAVAGAIAVAEGAQLVAYAAHAGDHPVYPDCRPDFARAMRGALALCSYEPVTLMSPFVDVPKSELVRLGAKLGAPLWLTWSCYDPQPTSGCTEPFVHCGRCGTCVERREAFVLARVSDPTVYAA